MTLASKRRSVSLRIIIYIFAALWLLIAAFPFVWTFWGSFKVELDFFSVANWTNALTGERTIAEYGQPFTDAGYEGAWIKEEFWRNVINTFIRLFFRCLYVTYHWNTGWLCIITLWLSLYTYFANCGFNFSSNAAHYTRFWLYAAIF